MSRGSEASTAGVQGKQGLSGTNVRGIWGDLEDRMSRHPGIRWHRAQIVSTVGENGRARDFPFPPTAICIVQMFVCACKEMSGASFSNNGQHRKPASGSFRSPSKNGYSSEVYTHFGRPN